MDDIAASASNELYERDFYAWTRKQAALLKQGRIDEADLVNLIEEIETLGRKEISELHSRYTVLVQHLLKQMFQPGKATRNWRTTILDQRIQIARHMRDNPSLKPKAEEISPRPMPTPGRWPPRRRAFLTRPFRNSRLSAGIRRSTARSRPALPTPSLPSRHGL